MLSREPRDVELFSGRLDGARLEAILRALVPVAAVDGFWLCGPFAMVEEHRAVLGRLGVPADRVRTELFHVDEPPPPVVHAEEVQTGESCRVDFTLDGRATDGDLTAEPHGAGGGAGGPPRRAFRLPRRRLRHLPRPGRRGRGRRCAATTRSRTTSSPPGFVLTCQALPVGDAVSVDFDA